ncbi:hypothetical protein [Mucilaginibacter sp. CSA2-8R]|uniref:hypothetical protein n=1 Tax=Mucilaginibacter sp. CSA2-8R TaxID=3141542 RepID=UPI00315D6D9A
MNIACLSWGSLIWVPGQLEIIGNWLVDGSYLPVEFCRQSADGRLTLVLTPFAKPVQVLWARMRSDNLDQAIESLRVREGTIVKNIGLVAAGEDYIDPIKNEILNWATAKNLDAVIYTNLPPKFSGQTMWLQQWMM